MNPNNYHFKLPRDKKPTNIRLPEVWYPGINQYWPKCTSTRKYNAIAGIKAIVIHATAGHSSDGAVSVMRHGKASWHWLVPDENEAEHGKLIWTCAPEALAAWHVRNNASHPDVNDGRNLVNHWSLGVEIVNSQQNDPFSDWQVQATADIVKYCWAKYPNLEHVVSHAKLDPTRRTDPGAHFPWERFKEYVLSDNYQHLLVYNEFIIHKTINVHVTEINVTDICC